MDAQSLIAKRYLLLGGLLAKKLTQELPAIHGHLPTLILLTA